METDANERSWGVETDAAIDQKEAPAFVPMDEIGDEARSANNDIKTLPPNITSKLNFEQAMPKKAEAESADIETLPSTVDGDEDIISVNELKVKHKTWDVVLRREQRGQVVGLILEKATDALCLKSYPETGLAEKWNGDHPYLAMRPADILESVNGISGTGPEVVQELRSSPELHIRMKRLLMFSAHVPVPAGGKLALDFVVNCNGHLEVAQVLEGAVSTYNTSCRAGHEILKGDIVVACNGLVFSNSPQALLDYLSTLLGNLVLWIKRTDTD